VFHKLLLRCRRQMGEASDSIFEPLMVCIVSFLLMSTLKLHEKYKIWDILSA